MTFGDEEICKEAPELIGFTPAKWLFLIPIKGECAIEKIPDLHWRDRRQPDYLK